MFPEFFIIHASVLMKRVIIATPAPSKIAICSSLFSTLFPRCLLRQQICLMKCINKSLPAAASGNCHAVPLSSVPLPAYFPMVKKILRPSNYVKIRSSRRLSSLYDSAPSFTDDSHTVLHRMPKIQAPGPLLFRRSPLSLFFFCACHIRKGTPESRNLYLKIIIARSTVPVNAQML